VKCARNSMLPSTKNTFDKAEFDRLTSSAEETARMINGLMLYLRGTSVKETKYRSNRQPQT